jgi:hypothetical protein
MADKMKNRESKLKLGDSKAKQVYDKLGVMKENILQ